MAATVAGQDLIADFKIGIDHLAITDLAGNPATTADIGTMVAGATANTSGAAVLHLSAVHDVTLQGISVSQLSTTMFG